MVTLALKTLVGRKNQCVCVGGWTGHLGPSSYGDTLQWCTSTQCHVYSTLESICAPQQEDKRGLLTRKGTSMQSCYRTLLLIAPSAKWAPLTQVGAELLKPLVCFLLVPHVFVFVLSRQGFQRENEPLQIDCSISHAEDMTQRAIWFWSWFNPFEAAALASLAFVCQGFLFCFVWSLRC